MPSPHLRALGTPALLTTPADPTVAMDVGKPLALLVYLTLSSVEASRDHLIDLLWAHVPPDRGRQSLRQALWQIRTRLGTESISQMGDRLRIAVPLGSDVAEFLKAVTERRAADAVKLDTAPFFQTFAAPGALEFEQWADTMRARLHTAFLRLGEEAVQLALGSGRPGEAVSLATRLRDTDLERQAGWRLLLQTLQQGGQLPTALLEAESLETRLRHQDDLIEEATARVLAEVRSARLPGETRSTTPTPWELTELVGRETQFASLLTCWQAAGRGRPQFAHIVAEPGLGKTRLLQELRTRIAASGASVVLVGARPEEKDAPYSLAADLAGALADLPGGRGVSRQSAASLVALDPRLASRYAESADPSDNHEGERRRLLALSDLLDSVAHERPTAVLIDDLHWADATSARVLSGALARSTGPTFVVTTSRPGRPGMMRDDRATVLGLDPLTPNAVAALLAGFGAFERDRDGEELAAKLHAMSSGSPLRALEALREATSHRLLGLADAHWTILDPEGLKEAWERMRDPADRLRRLPDADRLALLGLALWGKPATLAIVESILESSHAAVESACHRLERTGLASEHGGEWNPLHHTVSELIAAVAPGSEQQQLHLRIAALLRPAATDSRARREVVRHLWQGGDAAGVRATVAEGLQEMRSKGDQRPAATMLDELTPQEVPALLRQRTLAGLPVFVRYAAPPWLMGAVIAAALLLVLGGAYIWATRPAALAVRVAPIAINPLTPDPVVEVRDHLGRLVSTFADTITASMFYPGPVRLHGDTSVVAENGVARFINLLEEWETPLDRTVGAFRQIEFKAHDLRSVTISIGDSVLTARLRWRGAISSGRRVDPARDTLLVHSGDTLRLDADLEYDSPCPRCAVVLSGTPSWPGPRQQLYRIGMALATPAKGGRAQASFSFRVPDRPGVWHIVLAIGEESGSEFLMSSTNWKARRPRWNDGTDIADITPAQIETAARTGAATFDWDFSDAPSSDTTVHSDRVRRVPHGVSLGVAVMTVRVVGK